MALPGKGLRNITVDGVKYAWSVTARDEGMSLSIIPRECPHRIITAGFDYHYEVTGEHLSDDGTKVQYLKRTLIITGFIVRQVILYAVKTGWSPVGGPLVLNLESVADEIDLGIGRL